jgi:DNA replication licensing factor MCM4
MSKFTMTLAHAQSLFSDKQLIKIQESPNMIPEGETPHAVTAFVYDALVDFVRPGDRVTIVGAFRIPYFRPVNAVQLGCPMDGLHVK